jgi:YrbI family 3-deoxy-D-manno-octulosonate 8-phosphate phosphatase
MIFERITECAYIGDDVNDLPAMQACGLSFAPPNAHTVVRNSGAYVTASTGGNGCFREVADLILEKYAHQSW